LTIALTKDDCAAHFTADAVLSRDLQNDRFAYGKHFASKFACQPERRPMIRDCFLHAAANLGRIICAPLACEVSAWARPVVS